MVMFHHCPKRSSSRPRSSGRNVFIGHRPAGFQGVPNALAPGIPWGRRKISRKFRKKSHGAFPTSNSSANGGVYWSHRSVCLRVLGYGPIFRARLNRSKIQRTFFLHALTSRYTSTPDWQTIVHWWGGVLAWTWPFFKAENRRTVFTHDMPCTPQLICWHVMAHRPHKNG